MSLFRDENTGTRAEALSRPTATAIRPLVAVAEIESTGATAWKLCPLLITGNAQVGLSSSGVWMVDNPEVIRSSAGLVPTKRSCVD